MQEDKAPIFSERICYIANFRMEQWFRPAQPNDRRVNRTKALYTFFRRMPFETYRLLVRAKLRRLVGRARRKDKNRLAHFFGAEQILDSSVKKCGAKPEWKPHSYLLKSAA